MEAIEQVWLTIRNQYLISENPLLAWWFNDLAISEAEASLDLRNATESAKYCNWDHYQATKGWIA
jgi:hypothetical protein